MSAHETIIDGDTAIIRALPGGDLAPVARALLDAAGNKAGQVRTITNAPGLALAVPVVLARKAGLVHEPTAEKPAPAKTAPRPKGKPRKGK